MKLDHNNIKMIISDVDGVWTDGSIYIGKNGDEMKRFSVLDGVGVALAKVAKLKIVLLSGRFSDATENRARELGINEVFNGFLNKLPIYEKLKQKHKLNDDQIVYIGDDLIDLPIMKKVAFPVSVSNATQEVKDISVFITNSCGGEGAFREVVEWILDKKGKLKRTISTLNKNVKKL